MEFIKTKEESRNCMEIKALYKIINRYELLCIRPSKLSRFNCLDFYL